MKKKYFSTVLMLIFISVFSQNPIQTTPWNYETEGFEGGTFPPTDWGVAHFSGATTDWEHSTTVGGFQASTSCAFFNNTTATGVVHVLRTPSFDLTTAIEPFLKFDVAYARYDSSNSDQLFVYYTTNTNGTSGWTGNIIAQYSNDDLATAPNQTTPFTPDEASDWETFTIDLSTYVGLPYIRFAFEARPDQANGTTNNLIYIDNVDFFDESPLAPLAVKKEEIINFSVYPNPSEGNITLNTTLENLEKNNLEVRNILGQKFNNFSMTKNSSNSYQLNFDDYKSGMYFITVSSDEKSTTKKLYIK
jgi:hypothetical protein